MAIQQVSVFVQNKPGALSAICKLLAESGVDMRAMFIRIQYSASDCR